MKNFNLKTVLQTPKGKLSAAAALMVLALSFTAVNVLRSSSFSIFATEADIVKRKNDLDDLNAKYEKLLMRDMQTKKIEKNYDSLKKSLLTADEDAAALLRSAVEAAANLAGIKLNSVGAVRTNNLNDEIVMLEIDVTGTAAPDAAAKMLTALDAATPVVEWRKFDLRSGGRGPMESGSISFSGTLGLMQLTNGKANTVKK